MAGTCLENIWPKPNCDSMRNAAAGSIFVAGIFSSGADGCELNYRDMQHSSCCDLSSLFRPEFAGAGRPSGGGIDLLGPGVVFPKQAHGGTGVLARADLVLAGRTRQRNRHPDSGGTHLLGTGESFAEANAQRSGGI